MFTGNQFCNHYKMKANEERVPVKAFQQAENIDLVGHDLSALPD